MTRSLGSFQPGRRQTKHEEFYKKFNLKLYIDLIKDSLYRIGSDI